MHSLRYTSNTPNQVNGASPNEEDGALKEIFITVRDWVILFTAIAVQTKLLILLVAYGQDNWGW